MIIDAHAHIYPQKIADKATTAIGDFYGIKMNDLGVSENLLKEGKNAGISKYIVHSVATKPEQVRAINAFIKSQMDLHKEFIGFMTLHENMLLKEVEEEIDFCINQGFKGIKLHPDFQKFYIDSPKMNEIYKIVGGRLPILFHTGDLRYDYSNPTRLAKMAKENSNTVFIGAHFGGYRVWDLTDCYLGLDNVFFDTSSTLEFIDKDFAKKMIYKHGVEKFFFGTDFPMWDFKKEIRNIENLGLKENEKDCIFYKNISNLLKL